MIYIQSYAGMMPSLFFVCDKAGNPAAQVRESLNERIYMKEGSLYVFRYGRLIEIRRRKMWSKKLVNWIKRIDRKDVLFAIAITSGFLFAYWLDHR